MPYHDLLEAVKPVPFPFKLDGISKIDKLIIQNLARGQLLPKTPCNEKEKLCSKFNDKNKILSESIKVCLFISIFMDCVLLEYMHIYMYIHIKMVIRTFLFLICVKKLLIIFENKNYTRVSLLPCIK